MRLNVIELGAASDGLSQVLGAARELQSLGAVEVDLWRDIENVMSG